MSSTITIRDLATPALNEVAARLTDTRPLMGAVGKRGVILSRTSPAVRFLFFSFESHPPVRSALAPRLGRVLSNVDRGAFSRIIKLHKASGSPLELEGETKAVLGRFFAHSTVIPGFDFKSMIKPSAKMQQAVLWLEDHFTEPGVIEGLHKRGGLSLWHFRKAFRRLTGNSPQGYVTALRMRAARFFLLEGRLPVKEVAAKVGYDDPLYFSRAYRRFWGHPPSER